MKAEGLEPDTSHVIDSWIDNEKTKVPGVNYVGGRIPNLRRTRLPRPLD